MSEPKDSAVKKIVDLRNKNKREADLSNYVFGKLPPQARALEEATLGAIMLDKDALTVVIDTLRPDSFYSDAHQLIYKAMLSLFERTQPIDLLTVSEELKKTGDLEKIGGPYYLVELTNRVASSANLEFHARIVAQKYIQRELIRVSNGVIKDAYEDTTDVFELLDKAEQGLFEITEKNLSRSYASMSSLLGQAVKQVEEASETGEGLTGVPTGFIDLDRMTSGWQPSDLVIVAARPGMGKCLGKGTKIVMYDGTLKNVEDVVVGDLLMGDDSAPRTVLSLARGRETMYWVRQNKGIDYRVNESHILSLKRSRREGGHEKGAVLNITVKDYLSKSNKFQSNYKGYRVAVEFEEKPLDLAPYFVGLWLGDGTSAASTITTQDEEVIDYLQTYANELGLRLHEQSYENRCNNYSISGTTFVEMRTQSPKIKLRHLNLIDNKHIPQDYLINSTKNRLKLLAGLIDSDGHYLVQSNGYEIVQKNEYLSRQIKFLCDSLGFRTSFKKKKATIASIGYETEVYRLRIYGNIDTIPVKIERKKANPWGSPIDWHVTGIQLENDGVGDYYGFEIDGNRLFLLEDMTVTHNTAFTLALAANAASFDKPVAFFSLEMSSIQLVKRLISYETEIPGEKLKKGTLEDYEWQQLNAAVEKMSEKKIFIDDTPAINIFELRAKCRRLKMQHDIQMVMIDYLQLMSGNMDKNKSTNREQEISSISRALKGLAKELNIPVIALSQLSRAVETRGGTKRPMLSDLRECIIGETKIYIADTGAYKRVDELIGQNGFNVLAMDDEYMLTEAECLDVWATGEKEVYEVRTQSGNKITASLNHPFFTTLGWQQLVDIKEGDFVATPRTIHYNKPSELKDEEIILLGHMIGDGCYVKRQPVHYTSQDEASLDIVSESAQDLWNIQPRKVKDASSNCHHIYLPSPYHLTHGVRHPFTNLLHKVGLKQARSHEKELPKTIFQSSLEQVALFIKHLWATDGGIYIRKGKGASKIHYASNSYELIKGLKSLLLRFEISSSIQKTQKENYRPGYHLNITGKGNILRFGASIGIFGSKAVQLEKLVALYQDKTSNPNVDVISKQVWDEIKVLKKEKGFTERSFQKELGTQYSGSSLYKSNLSRQRLAKIADILESEELNYLANSDIKWDKIISIKHIGKEMTYDLHVADYHNFVANDFIIHNSGAIEQDADMVTFIYRPEYYQILEDEEGNSLKGKAEVIIAKHRNGALGTVDLRFTGETAKFSNWADAGFDDFSAAPTGNTDSPMSNIITRPSKMNDGFDDVPF